MRRIKRWQQLASVVILTLATAVLGSGFAVAQAKPEGEMRFALYVTLAPAWLDPGEAVPGVLTPFWVLYALHDALVKPMPGEWHGAQSRRVVEGQRRSAEL